MGVYDFAMQMEKDGEAYYRDLASNTGDKGLQTILTMMADEEVKHYNTFKAMNEGKSDMPESTIMNSVKNVFEELHDQGENKVGAFGTEARDAYLKAQEVEKKSEDLYREKAEAEGDEKIKKTLHRIADEEHRHWQILENMIEMIDNPKSWLENAEWRQSKQF